MMVRAVPLEEAPETRLPEDGSGPAPSVHPTDSSTPEGDRAAARRRRRLVILAAVAAGIVLRLMQYAVNRALWLDEALLTANLLGRDWAGLFGRPLDYAQTAPWGFLAAEKLISLVLGTSEYALRLLPLIAGIAGVLLAPRVARRLVSRPAVPLAVAVFALAPYLVYYSSEIKQYALDATLTLAVLGLAWDAARSPSPKRAALLLGAAGAAAVWFSQPVVFVLAGTTLAVGLHALRRGDRARVAA
ncbi:MAG TPA: glycosyltransferase family 39 protein, partial [Longimicrobium sp.]|nr:glycosyltransferase family 39 protein [Longimicrobium sp.]